MSALKWASFVADETLSLPLQSVCVPFPHTHEGGGSLLTLPHASAPLLGASSTVG